MTETGDTPARYADHHPGEVTPCARKGLEKRKCVLSIWALPNNAFLVRLASPLARATQDRNEPRTRENEEQKYRVERMKGKKQATLEFWSLVRQLENAPAGVQACRTAGTRLKKDRRDVLECSVTPNQQHIVLDEGNVWLRKAKANGKGFSHRPSHIPEDIGIVEMYPAYDACFVFILNK